MPHAANLDGVDIWAGEEEAVVAYAQPKFVCSFGELSHHRLCKAKECREDMHRDARDQADGASPVMHPIERSLLTLGLASCPKR